MFKVAILQKRAINAQIEKNMESIIMAMKEASENHADILLLPECFVTGYDLPMSYEKSIADDDKSIAKICEKAKKYKIGVVLTAFTKGNKQPQNSAFVINKSGNILMKYSKVHTCDFGDECRLDAGEDFFVASLDTEEGTVQVGSMICYDREFPESARILMLKGAELILTPNACPMEINRLSQLRGRAYENMTAIATCNYPSPHPDCNGHSTVFDGVAYLPELSGSRNTCILEAGEDEGIYLAELDMDMLREYRKREVHGNAYRRPEKYGILTETAIQEPFIRADRRRECSDTIS